MDRRGFLSWVGVGWVASSLPVALATQLNGCSSSPQGNSQGNQRTDGFVAIGSTDELEKSGQLLKEQFSRGPALVIRNPNDPNTLTAVNPTCPHQGCLVAWKTEKKAFVCPCHGAMFAADGKVLQGPAKKDLPTYEAKLEGQTVLVKG